MRYLVISDLHIGRGKFLEDGTENIKEDFDQDEKLIEFFNYYEQYDEEIHLILNGDIFNLLDFSQEELILEEGITEEMVLESLERIFFIHQDVFLSLKKFFKKHQGTYIIGNHDFGVVFPKAQEFIQNFLDKKIPFVEKFFHNEIYIEHGQRFETVNHTSLEEAFVKNKKGKDILNIPWASCYILHLLPKFKEKRRYMDKIRPMAAYIKWTMFHDTKFFFYMIYHSLIFIFYTLFGSKYKYRRASFSLSLFKKITIVSSFINMAKQVLFKEEPSSKIVILGHTHIFEWRRFKENKYYFNSGCWNALYSMNITQHAHIYGNYYVSIRIEESSVMNAKIKRWRGSWQPFTDEVKELFGNKKNDQTKVFKI